jgi:hypothetical protein
MQGILARIDANRVCDCRGCLMGHGDVLLVLLSPNSFSERFGAGARPVHPILGKTIAFVEGKLLAQDGTLLATAMTSVRLLEAAKALRG